MTWTKTGDEFADECWSLSDAAYRLHHEGLTWSNRKSLDGQLAKDDLRRWAKSPEAATELVDMGWWEDSGQHYQIVHHLGYQRTREEVARQSLVNRQNGRKGGRPPKVITQPVSDLVTDSVNEPVGEPQTETITHRDRPGLANASPTKGSMTDQLTLVPTTSKDSVVPKSGTSLGEPAAKTKRGTRLPADWVPPAEKVAAARTRFPHVNLDLELEKFHNWAAQQPGQRGVKLDWTAAWRNWIINAAERTPTMTSNGNSPTPIATSDLRVQQVQALKRNGSAINTNRLELE